MYRRVPPPEHNQELRASAEEKAEEVDESKPENVASDQWKRFQELKARRVKECGQTGEKRRASMKKRVLQTVAKELTDLDKELLAADGVKLPNTSRKRKRPSSQPDPGDTEDKPECSNVERRWGELRPFLDPNPQLRGLDKGRYAEKSKLEEEMDEQIERGHYEAAATISDKLSQREFATKVATAFNCLEYSTMKEEEKQKKAKRKRVSSVHSFPPKQRWERKSNM